MAKGTVKAMAVHCRLLNIVLISLLWRHWSRRAITNTDALLNQIIDLILTTLQVKVSHKTVLIDGSLIQQSAGTQQAGTGVDNFQSG
jgi:hypothetical protein